MEGGLNFSGYESNYGSNKKNNFRKAGEVFDNKSETNQTTESRKPSENSAYSKWMTFMGGQDKNYQYTNTSTNSNTNENNTVKTNPQPSQPASNNKTTAEEIDFAAWAADTASGDKSSGQDAAYWEKKYRQNYAEDQARKAKFDSYTGIKTQEEFNAADQANWDKNSKNINAYTSQMHKNYGEFSGYQTLKSQQGHFDKAAEKWKLN